MLFVLFWIIHVKSTSSLKLTICTHTPTHIIKFKQNSWCAIPTYMHTYCVTSVNVNRIHVQYKTCTHALMMHKCDLRPTSHVWPTVWASALITTVLIYCNRWQFLKCTVQVHQRHCVKHFIIQKSWLHLKVFWSWLGLLIDFTLGRKICLTAMVTKH